MGFDGVRFLVQVRKLAIRTIRTSYRSVRNHPFLVTALVIAVLLYRSSPFLFSLLVSASPVLVCTAVLLGTLLSFGNPQIPQIEKEESVSSEISSLRTETVQNSAHYFQKEAVVFGRGDLYTDTTRQVSAERGVEEAPLLDADGSVGKFRESTLTPQNSQEIVFEQLSADEENAKYKNREVEAKKENGDEAVAVEFEGVPSTYEVQGRGYEIDRSVEGSVDGHRDDHFESASVPWTRVNGDEDEDEVSDSDSGSDGAESSSPDPSMADIIPLLDELHPLIESEELVSGNLSRENSGLLSHTSHNSGESSIDSDGESDHEGEEEGAGDGDEEEEENQGDKESAEKSAITWTEDDEKNLMDLGSSELERNQRLESLIARRRARRMMTERNLIDLDGFDLPFQVPMISTTRQNPFDFPNDAYDDMGLPPIPGSAPSVLLPRRNPFDIPYDSSEEKPDLMGDSFQQEFKELNQKEAVKEPVFRRHESFHMGSSFFDFPRQEGRGASRASRFRPYFIPERLDSEGIGHSSFVRQPSDISEESPSFQRQTSELSGTSSFHRQASGISVSSSFQRQSSDLSESKASSAAETEPLSVNVDQEEAKLSDHDSSEERIPDSGIDHASDHVEHGSRSSYSPDDQSERRDFDLNMHAVRLGESESHTGTEFHQAERGHIVEINLGVNRIDPELDSWISESRNLAASAGNIVGEGHLMSEPVDDNHYSSSSSSSSEEHNDIREADGGLVIREEIEFHLLEKHDAQDDKYTEASDFYHHLSGHTHSAERTTLETIEEEHISSPSSSLVSDEHKSTSLKLDEDLVNMGQIMPDVEEASDAPNEQALDVSNNALTMAVEDIQDPVYDSSPQAGKNLPSISSEHGLVDFTELEDKDLKQENDDHLSKYEDDTDACVPMVYDDSLNLTAVEEMHSEAVSEYPSAAQADLFYVSTESTEEPNLVDEDALQSKEADLYEANLIDVPGKFKDNQVDVADEVDSVKDGLLIHPPPSEGEELSSVTPERLEEISNSDKAHSEANAEMNHLHNLPQQTDATSSNVPESGLEPAAVFDFGEPVEERPEIESQHPVAKDADRNFQLEGSVVPEYTIGDEIPDVEEALLSELDAVGDFLVTDVGMDMKQDTVGVEEFNASEFIRTDEDEREVGDMGIGMELNSHTPDSQTRLDVSEPESDHDGERSRTVESLRFQDEPRGENIEESIKVSEFVTADNELMQFDGNINVLERDQPTADICGSAPAMVEELESSDVAGIYTASISHVSSGSEVIEKDETALVDKEVVDVGTRDTMEVENAETGLELKFHSLGSKNKSDFSESESSQGVEVSGAVEPFHLHDEIQTGESEDGSLEDSEYGGMTRNELVTNDAEDKPTADTSESALAMGEEMKSSGVAGIENDETALGNKEVVDINTSNARMVENTETEMGLNSHIPVNKTRFDVSESLSNQDNEDSLHLQDEVQREETEGGPVKDSEYAIAANETLTKDGSVPEKDELAVDTCGPTPSMEEGIESSHVLNNNNATETDETGLGDKEVVEINTRDAMEVENPQADATMQFEAAQPVSPHVATISPSLPSESTGIQDLKVEDHQIVQKHFPMEQLETSTSSISAVEKSDGQ